MSPEERRRQMPSALRGAAALWEMFNLIGELGKDDHDVARLLTENEMELRSLVAFIPSLLEFEL